MANVNAPNGLTPVGHLLGGEIRVKKYRIASGLAENIGFGAPVKSTGTTKRIQLAAASDVLRGVFAGVKYTDSNGNTTFSKNWVSGTTTLNSAEAEAYVYDDPWIIYEVQADGTFAEADIGLNADLTTGAASSGISTAEVDLATKATTAALQVKILDYVRREDNEVGADTKLLVLINEHELKATTAGV